jgi:MOSC domain-containing protein YiiM
MITLKAIAIKSGPRATMQQRNEAEITIEKGITGDFRGSQSDRQITILSESSWQKACASVNADLSWMTRRANLLLDGVVFSAQDVGKSVRIGEVILKITQETKPCSLMDELHQGLRNALTPDWRGGVCCKVVEAGSIQAGDHVEID